MLQRLFAGFAVAAALLLTSSECFAQFRVCNRSSAPSIEVAYGHGERSGRESEGWFTVGRRDCATLIGSALRERRYYLYATAADVEWNGDDDKGGADFCTRPDEGFKLNDNEVKEDDGKVDCEKHGYETRKFFQVDTNGATTYTFNFED